jgi:HK97 family phage prohead protease
MEFTPSFEIKSLSETGLIEGLAAGYGNVDDGGDIVASGAFKSSIGTGRHPAMLLYHDPSRPVGRWDEFTETPDGLLARGRLTLDAPEGKSTYALVRDKALTGLSVGYKARKADFDQAKGIRTIVEADLFEVSLVTFPMNSRTRISAVKSIEGVRDIETVLREAGLSSREAKAAAGAAWRAIRDKSDESALADILKTSSARIADYWSN